MRKRSSKQGPEDINKIASRVLKDVVGDEVPERSRKNPAAVELGRLGGRVGGLVRAERLTPEKRSDIARHAAEVRWSKKGK